MTNFTENFTEQAFNGGPDPLLELLEVEVDGQKYFYTNNTENVISSVSGSLTPYRKGSFRLTLPESKLEGTPTSTLEFGAADSEVIEYLRSSERRVKLRLWLVLASDPNYAEYGPVEFESLNYTISGRLVSLQLTAEPQLNITLPGKRYTPATFPFLWK